jgi:hypothetical protein
MTALTVDRSRMCSVVQKVHSVFMVELKDSPFSLLSRDLAGEYSLIRGAANFTNSWVSYFVF